MDNMQNRDTIDFLKPENRFTATPMDLLRQGILRKRWDAVEACYLMLTGEQLHTPSDAEIYDKLKQIPMPEPVCPTEPTFTTSDVKQPEVVKRKRGRPRKVQPVQEPKTTNEPEAEVYDAFANCTAQARAPGTQGKNYGRSRAHDCKPHPNTFKDNLTDAPDEIVKDRKVPKEILENKRPPDREWKVRCASCGAQDKIDTEMYKMLLVKGRGVKHQMAYRCNGCITGGANPAEMDLPEVQEEEETIDE